MDEFDRILELPDGTLAEGLYRAAAYVMTAAIEQAAYISLVAEGASRGRFREDTPERLPFIRAERPESLLALHACCQPFTYGRFSGRSAHAVALRMSEDVGIAYLRSVSFDGIWTPNQLPENAIGPWTDWAHVAQMMKELCNEITDGRRPILDQMELEKALLEAQARTPDAQRSNATVNHISTDPALTESEQECLERIQDLVGQGVRATKDRLSNEHLTGDLTRILKKLTNLNLIIPGPRGPNSPGYTLVSKVSPNKLA